MQIRTHNEILSHPVRIAVIKKTIKMLIRIEKGMSYTVCTLLMGMLGMFSKTIRENSMEVQKLERNYFLARGLCSSYPITGYIAKGNETSISERYLHSLVYCSTHGS